MQGCGSNNAAGAADNWSAGTAGDSGIVTKEVDGFSSQLINQDWVSGNAASSAAELLVMVAPPRRKLAALVANLPINIGVPATLLAVPAIGVLELLVTNLPGQSRRRLRQRC